MKTDRIKFGFNLVVYFVAVLFMSSSVFAQIPTGQDAGAVERLNEKIKKDAKVTDKLIKGKSKSAIEDAGLTDKSAKKEEVEGPKVLINSIEVVGVTAFTPEHIRLIVSEYEGMELSLNDFNKIADIITNEYRKAGNLTSMAYLAPQKISNNKLIIAVSEGLVGDVKIRGNKWFSKKLLERYLDQRKGDLFNYESLRAKINFINENPDLQSNVYLARGKEVGETDIDVEVKDHFPFHVTLGGNNYNSKYVERLKYLMELKTTNFLGLGHVFSVETQLGESTRYKLYSARYLAPLGRRHSIGINYIHLNQRLGREVGDLRIKGTGDIASLFYSYKMIDREDFTFSITPGFTYKDIDNEILENVSSEDNMRIAKLGFDLDYTDSFNGRTIVTQEFDFGLKGFMGGLDENDVHASRGGSDGDFFRSVTNAARIQLLPYDLSMMINGSMQLTNDDLPSAEQFFIGGPTSVRAYPVSEHGGDKGYTLSTELFVPPYFIDKEQKVPFTETNIYDALRFVYFVDWGFVSINTAQSGETKRNTLYSCGPALRFNIPERLSVSLDYGVQLGQRASDGRKSQLNLEVKLFF